MAKLTRRRTDAGLFRLEQQFLASFEALEAATDRMVAVEKQAASDVHQAEMAQQKLSDATNVVAQKMLRTRANTLAGMRVKLRVNKKWDGTFEDEKLLESISADINAIEGAGS